MGPWRWWGLPFWPIWPWFLEHNLPAQPVLPVQLHLPARPGLLGNRRLPRANPSPDKPSYTSLQSYPRRHSSFWCLILSFDLALPQRHLFVNREDKTSFPVNPLSQGSLSQQLMGEITDQQQSWTWEDHEWGLVRNAGTSQGHRQFSSQWHLGLHQHPPAHTKKFPKLPHTTSRPSSAFVFPSDFAVEVN